MFERTIVIGCGGIWAYLSQAICRISANPNNSAPKELILVDGDEFTISNFERQDMREEDENEKKSEVHAKRIIDVFRELSVQSVSEFLTKENADKIIQDKSIILSCVDNHATRKLISEEARKKSDVIVISGGNDLFDGSVHLYMVFGGEPLTQNLEDIHPEVKNPEDRNPGELSCEERAELPGGGQLPASNLLAASWMATYFASIVELIPRGKEVLEEALKELSEVYFDARKFAAVVYNRAVQKTGNFARK